MSSPPFAASPAPEITPVERVDPDRLAALLEPFDARVRSEPSDGGRASCIVRVDATHVLDVFTRLREDESMGMRRLVDLTVVDRFGQPDAARSRFLVVYELHSATTRQRLRVEAAVEEGASTRRDSDREAAESLAVAAPTIDSVSKLWPVAVWLEREAFDLFGVDFRGHPDLRRLLLDEGFEGAPLRKDHLLQPGRALPIESRP